MQAFFQQHAAKLSSTNQQNSAHRTCYSLVSHIHMVVGLTNLLARASAPTELPVFCQCAMQFTAVQHNAQADLVFLSFHFVLKILHVNIHAVTHCISRKAFVVISINKRKRKKVQVQFSFHCHALAAYSTLLGCLNIVHIIPPCTTCEWAGEGVVNPL